MDECSLHSEEETCKVYPISKKRSSAYTSDTKEVEEQEKDPKESENQSVLAEKESEEKDYQPPPFKRSKTLTFKVRDY